MPINSTLSRRSLLLAAASPAARIETITKGPAHHFFGYYGIPPWSESQKLLICLKSSFQDRLPNGTETAGVMLIEAGSYKITRIAETRAWNLQQGAMLHWNPGRPNDEILYNDAIEGQLRTVVLNIHNGKRRVLPMALAGVANRGGYALCLNYARLAKLRPVVGIQGVRDSSSPVNHPEDDGAFLMDLETGKTKLVLSVADTYRRLKDRHPELTDRAMFFNHTVFSKDDRRFFVLSRCFEQGRLESAMFSANLDGTDVREAVPYGRGISHFDWKNGREILATFRDEQRQVRHYLFEDGKQNFTVLGRDFFAGDGHCSYSPDTRWIVSDANHSEDQTKELLLFHPETDRGYRLGRQKVGKYLSGDTRCDLHPRFSRDGRQICFDSIADDGTRQVHIATPNL